MTKKEFLTNIQQNCTEILYLSTAHILNKLYKNENDILKNYQELFANYKNYHFYLNDYAGTIYSKYSSSVDSLYIEMCKYLDIEIDNKYTLEHTIVKLEKQTIELLLNLTNEEMQTQAIIHYEEKLNAIKQSVYYQNNLSQYQNRFNKLKENIKIVKNSI
jgi:hypothetical protein